MLLIRQLFSGNFELSAEERERLRRIVRWVGLLLAGLGVPGLTWLGIQDPSPESGRWFDVATKAAFAGMRLVLAIAGWLVGVALGYLTYQVLETTKGGCHATRFEPSDPMEVKDAKIRNRGLLLVVCVVACAVVMALALSGAGGR